MVSLYRAWAAWRGIGLPGAPDALIQVGGVRFTAHARLLAAHSGYFKSVLSRTWNPTAQSSAFRNPEDARAYEEGKEGEAYETEYERERRELELRYHEARNSEGTAQGNPEENVVYVPNITAQQFWPLLAYMYTGYLELTTENIYQVLLATHLLHMPRALELCRNFLSHGSNSSPPQSLPTTVVKPIPSRKLPSFLTAPIPYRPIFAEAPMQYLGAPYDTPFKPVESTSFTNRISVIEATTSAENRSQEETLNVDKEESSTLVPTNENPDVLKQSELQASSEAATSKPVRHNTAVPNAINLVKAKKIKTLSKKSKADKRDNAPETPENVVILKEKPEYRIASFNEEKVVVDVACCDGPVRFHRVLNKAYRAVETESSSNAIDSSDSEDSYVEVEEDSRSQSETTYDNCNAFSKSLQKQMTENIRNMNKQNENHPGYVSGEDNQGKVDGQDDASNSLLSNRSQDTIYTCVYCNHTFKSQYCYQKHARRHLNPVSIDAVNQGTVEFVADECCKIKKVGIKVNPINSGPKREVRLLDMNVQYYPCKTCGSKFPSYYFVHKHRKMCHAEELENGVETGNKTNNTAAVSAEKKRKLSGNFEETQAEDNNEGTNKKPEQTTQDTKTFTSQ